MGVPERPSERPSPLRRRVLRIAARLMLLLAVGSFMVAVLISTGWLAGEEPNPWDGVGVTLPALPPTRGPERPPAPPTLVPPTRVPTPTPTQEVVLPDTPVSSNGMRVGIVAGHAGYDSGAVCDDGLTEAEVNLIVAQWTETLLRRQGYQVDLLDEFDNRLAGYRADALVSIHADSCQVPGASGFKVARVTDSAIPQAEDRLVNCIYREYENTTGIPRHPNSVTDNMTNYHAFREIQADTPGAIIEIGFMLDDRIMLTGHPRQLAQGIVAGIACFLEPH